MEMEKRIKRLVVNLTEREHKRLKILAAERNITISRMVMQALVKYVDKNFVFSD
jgi:hypothetical protein